MVKIQMQYKERSHWTSKSRTEMKVKSHQKKRDQRWHQEFNWTPWTRSEAGGSDLEARCTYEALKEESGNQVEFRNTYITHAALRKRTRVGQSGA